MRSRRFAVATNFLRLLVRVLYVRIRGEQTKSFGQAFSKACGFLRQSLKPLSADSGTLLAKRSFEGLKGNFSHEEKFPLTVFIVLLYLRKYAGDIFAEAVSQ